MARRLDAEERAPKPGISAPISADCPVLGTRIRRLCTQKCRPTGCGCPDLATLHLLVQTARLWVPGPGDSAPPRRRAFNRRASYQAFCERGNLGRCRLPRCGYPEPSSVHREVQTTLVWVPIPGDSAPPERVSLICTPTWEHPRAPRLILWLSLTQSVALFNPVCDSV